MRTFRLVSFLALLLSAARLTAQDRFIYAEPVHVEAGQEAELVVKMDYDTGVADVSLWKFNMVLPEGVELATPDDPVASVTLSMEMLETPITDEFEYRARMMVYYSSFEYIHFELVPRQTGFSPLTFEPLKSTHGELMRVKIKAATEQTVEPAISMVSISDSYLKYLVVDDVDQFPDRNNTLYIGYVDIHPTPEFTLSVKMVNNVAVEGFSFDISLPTSMDIVLDEEGKPMASLSEERNAAAAMNTFSVVKLNNWLNPAYRIIAASSDGKAIAPGDGEVCTLRLRLGTGATAEKYQVTMLNISVADADAVSHDVEQLRGILTVRKNNRGDANGDGQLTVADLTAIAHHVLGNTPVGFSEEEADANEDGQVNVADYTAVAHLLLYGSIEGPSAARRQDHKTAEEATDILQLDNTLYITPAKASAGDELTLSVNMKNSVAAEGFQFTLRLPEGVSVVCDADGFAEASLSTQRTTAARTNTFATSLLADGTLRVMGASTTGQAIAAGDGEVCTVTVRVGEGVKEGCYDMLLTDVAISDTAARSYGTEQVKASLTIGDPSAVRDIERTQGHGTAYDLQGRVADEPAKGLIIRDGKKYAK